MRRLSATCFFLFLMLPLAPFARAQFPPAPGTGPGLPETIEAIDSARVTTRILYITAHPDDESAAVLTYLARGLHAEVALLSLTRGEGGQNALGPEQAPQLGLIRTQELLAATRGYGVKLYFTRARDFGFSKTPEETQKIWGDQVLEDMVRVVRDFRPNIVINHFGGVHTGHGHHQTEGLWTPKAVQLAGDEKAYPELLQENLRPWNGGDEGIPVLDLDRSDAPKGYVLGLDEVSPLWGKTWREIGIDAFSNHRTQGIAGFLNSAFLRRSVGLIREDGKEVNPASLAESLASIAAKKGPCGCEEQLKAVDKDLDAAKRAALNLDWPAAVASLISADKGVDKASLLSIPSPIPAALAAQLDLLHREKQKVDRALTLAAGIELIADADRADLAVGDEFSVALHSRCRQKINCQFEKSDLNSLYAIDTAKKNAEKSGEVKWTVALGKEQRTMPVIDQLRAEPPPVLSINQQIALGDYTLYRVVPVTNTASTSTTVTRVPVRIVPAYSLSTDPAQFIEVLNAPHQAFDVYLRVHSYSTKAAKISVGLDVPDGLTATAPVELSFEGIGDQYAKFTVTPPAKLAAGNFTIGAYAKRGNEKFATSLEPLPSMPTQLWSEPAQSVVHAFDINVPANLHVGYISAEGEPIPDALRRLGIDVELIDAKELAFGNFSKYDAIVVGVRAYELRPELPGANKRLLDYVQNGGTLVVQYNRDNVWDRLQPAPYPAKIGTPTPRITDENATVTFLKPDDALLNKPNKLTAADFQDWIQ
ncbi:MAG TPA: PIG-L family deacetylase, partial [Candidatus Acidoferrum sp.]